MPSVSSASNSTAIGRAAACMYLAQLLAHRNGERLVINIRDNAITAPHSRSQAPSETAHDRSDLPRTGKRIACQTSSGYPQCAFIRRRDKTRCADPQRGPRLPRFIDSAEHHERLFRKEPAMLLRHVVANPATRVDVHPLAHARTFLRGEFTGMKGRFHSTPARRRRRNRSGGKRGHDGLGIE